MSVKNFMKIYKKKVLEKSVTYLLLICQIKMHFEEIYSVSSKCMKYSRLRQIQDRRNSVIK